MSTAAVQKPVSDKRLAANRANALKSTGPRTRAGKAKVSRNACRHYLYSRKHLACDETLREAARRIELSLRGVSNPIECVHRADVAFWTALLDDQARLEAQLYDWAAEQNSGNWRRAAHWLYTTQSKLFAALQTRYLSFGHRFDQAQSRYRRFQKLQSESATSSCAGTQPSKVGRTPPSARDPLVPPAAAIAAIVGNVLQAAAAKTPAEQTQFERLQPSKVGRTPPSARDPLVPPAAAIAAMVGNVLQAPTGRTITEQTQSACNQPTQVSRFPRTARDPSSHQPAATAIVEDVFRAAAGKTFAEQTQSAPANGPAAVLEEKSSLNNATRRTPRAPPARSGPAQGTSRAGQSTLPVPLTPCAAPRGTVRARPLPRSTE